MRRSFATVALATGLLLGGAAVAQASPPPPAPSPQCLALAVPIQSLAQAVGINVYGNGSSAAPLRGLIRLLCSDTR